ncbi:hypothetical protein ACQRET_05135 [Streptomyces koyangensis]|uniref:hypothetical protein n=1 Tax=Streptomyces koyangensis TaxID=188770 RepID=UPI003D0052ED
MSRREAELDRDVAALLAAMAFIEIRHLAGSAGREPGGHSEKTLDHLRFLADLCHNLPGVARPRPSTPSRPGASPGLEAGDRRTSDDRGLEHPRPEGAGMDTAPRRTGGTNLDAAPAAAGAA